jgi:acyl-CoA reductase LuxC
MNPPSLLPIDVRTPFSRESLAEVAGHLRLQGGEALRKKTRAHVIQTLAGIAKCWCLETYSLRKKALDLLPKNTGFSREMIARGIDLTFSKINKEVLSDYCNNELETFFKPGPGVIGHVAPGNLFAPVVQSLFHGLLVQSPNLIRTSENDLHFPVLLAQSLIDADLELTDAIAVAHWSSANMGLNRELARESDTLVVYGSDATLAEWRALQPAGRRFVGFGHRLSAGFISKAGLEKVDETAPAAALDITLYNQQGCLSPHCFYLEDPSPRQWNAFGVKLAEELRRLDEELPFGALTRDQELVIGNIRDRHRFLASMAPDGAQTWFAKTAAWTVLFDKEPAFTPSVLSRTIWLRPVPNLRALGKALAKWRGKLQCLGTDVPNEELHDHIPLIRDLGFTRICALGAMQAPPITWPNGGTSLLKQLTASMPETETATS